MISRFMRVLRATAGLDATYLDTLPVHDRGQLTVLALSVWLSAGTIGAGMGALVLLATDARSIGFASVLAGTLFTLNLHRLLLAGSALALDELATSARWTPSWGPLWITVAVAAVLSQPLLVVGYAATHDDTLDLARAVMVGLRRVDVATTYERRLGQLDQRLEAQRQALDTVEAQLNAAPAQTAAELAALRRERRHLREKISATGAQRDRLRDEYQDAAGPVLDAYERHLRESTLMVQRLRIAWATPIPAALFALSAVLAACAPVLLRWRLDHATLLYLQARHDHERALVRAHHEATRARAAMELHRWPTFQGWQLTWLDAPFDTQRAPPLRPPPNDERLEACTVAEILARLPTS